MIKRVCFGVLGVPALLCGSPLKAASWEVLPRVSTEALYESNAGLSVDEDVDGASGQVAAELDMRRQTERTTTYIAPAVSLTRFFKDELEVLDRESYFVNAGVDHRTERSEIGIRGRFSQQPAYRSELDAAIPDDPDDPAPSGAGDITILDDEQTAWNIQPYWDYQLTRRDTISASARYMDVEYDESGATTGRFDYVDAVARLEWAHSFTPRGAAVFAVFAGDYDADLPEANRSNESRYYGGTVGYRWRTSETSTVQLNVGATTSDESLSSPTFCTDPGDIAANVECEISDEDTHVSGDLSWRKRSELVDINLGLSRSVSPTSQGRQQIRDAARLYLNRRFSERLSGRVGIVAYRQDNAAGAGDIERDYMTAEVGGAWQLNRRWSVTAGYRYLQRETDDSGAGGDDFDNHEIRIGVAWEALAARGR